jgi:hypothetical protein
MVIKIVSAAFVALAVMLACVSLAGCSPNMDVKPVTFGQSTGIVSGANLRLVTERAKLANPKVVCTEPSPDYAIAFDRTRKLVITPPADAGSSKIDIDASTVEDVTPGAGREAGVLALRDGLYTACQSYANGVIGQDAYAIILSQYGNLLVALVGKDSAAAKVQPSGAQSAFAALLVACISSHDGSRSTHGGNVLLTPQFCSQVLNKALNANLAASGAAVGGGGTQKKPTQEKAAQAEKPATGGTKTTTETNSSKTTTVTTKVSG